MDVVTITEALERHRVPVWYREAGTVAHLITKSNHGHTTLCSYTVYDLEEAKPWYARCVSCQRAITKLASAVTEVQPEYVRETLTVVVTRPASQDVAAVDAVHSRLSRMKSWEVSVTEVSAEGVSGV